MGVASDGSYGIPAGLNFSFPVECSNGSYKIVQGLKVHLLIKVWWTIKDTAIKYLEGTAVREGHGTQQLNEYIINNHAIGFLFNMQS